MLLEFSQFTAIKKVSLLCCCLPPPSVKVKQQHQRGKRFPVNVLFHIEDLRGRIFSDHVNASVSRLVLYAGFRVRSESAFPEFQAPQVSDVPHCLLSPQSARENFFPWFMGGHGPCLGPEGTFLSMFIQCLGVLLVPVTLLCVAIRAT